MIAQHEPTIEQYVRCYLPYGQGCDYPGGCKNYASEAFMRTNPSQDKIYRCLNHIPPWKSDWRKAIQYGFPEIRARYPGVFFESHAIRHPSGATLECFSHHSVFTYSGETYVGENQPLDELLEKYDLEDWNWKVVVPGVLDGWSNEKRFESGDPKLYTHCQACGESVEGQKAYWSYGQYHAGTCYDTLFADCMKCGQHRMDAQTNRSPHAHLQAKYAAQLCRDCLHERWQDRDFKAFADAKW